MITFILGFVLGIFFSISFLIYCVSDSSYSYSSTYKSGDLVKCPDCRRPSSRYGVCGNCGRRT